MLLPTVNRNLLQASHLYSFLLAGLYSLTLTAYEGLCDSIPLRQDPIFLLRAGLIIWGLLAPFLAMVIFFREVNTKSTEVESTKIQSIIIWHLSVILCLICVGWIAFPYLVNGIFRAYHWGGPCYLNAYDPKDLMPMIWLGGVWYIIAIAIFIISPLCILGLSLSAVITFIRRRANWKQFVLTCICLIIAASALYLDPCYYVWFWD